MGPGGYIPYLQISGTVVALSVAALSDLKKREVPNRLWVCMGVLGTVLNAFDIFQNAEDSLALIALVAPLGNLMIFMGTAFLEPPDMELWLDGRPQGGWSVAAHVVGVLCLGIVVYTLGFWRALPFVVPAFLIVVYYMLYRLRLLTGGADAKAFMALALVATTTPRMDAFSLPLAGPEDQLIELGGLLMVISSFSISVLMNSFLCTMAFPLYFLIKNLLHGEWGGLATFTGYTMDLDRAEASFVWPMEHVVDGRRIKVLWASSLDTEEAYESLRKAGINRIWVTPKIPMLVPVLLATILTFALGNCMLRLIFAMMYFL